MQSEKLKNDTLVLSITQNPHIALTNSTILEDIEEPCPGRKTLRFDIEVRNATIVIELEPPSRALIYFAIFLVSLQILDGMLTSIGMARFGIHSEGNPLLKNLMIRFSPDQALVAVKTLAVLMVVTLSVVANRMKWVRDIIGVLSCIYLFAAIIPWIYIITHYF
jgi:hypothetical protein